MSNQSKAGIRTAADGQAYIPASRRADGSTRKEIKVRPGYRPPEDVERYQSKTAEAWRNREDGGVPGAESESPTQKEAEMKNKNAKRREAARKRKEQDQADTEQAMSRLKVADQTNGNDPATADSSVHQEDKEDGERQKKIRNTLKKLRAVRDLKDKKASGEKLSADQLVKISKESEIIKDLVKLDYDGPEIQSPRTSSLSEM